jgi:predicted SAM-dependent methyltransferase
MTDGLQSLKQIDAVSVDIVFSQAVLEHIHHNEFLDTMQQCRRILMPNGICSHQVDLRDHLGGALNNLRFSNRVWESNLFVNSGFYTNRIRYNQMLELFIKAGFKPRTLRVSKWSILPTPRKKMDREFQSVPDEELLVSMFDILLKEDINFKP